MSLVLLIVLGGLMHAARSFGAAGGAGSSGTSLALGYLLITGYFAGKMVSRLRLPKLTGYLLAGAVVGPSLLGLISAPMVESLELVNGMAVSMIALTAGTELELKSLRPLVRTVVAVTVIAVLGTIVLLAATVYLMRATLPFLAELDDARALAIAAVLGIVMVAQSPAVVVALRDELHADGPMTRTALAVVVLADLVVIFLFALASTTVNAAFGASASLTATAATLAWEICGSLIAGLLVGMVLVLYLGKVRGGSWLFLLAVTFVIAEIGGRLDFDPLLLALAAGAWVRNSSSYAGTLHGELELSALPVYILFFCLAGATLHLEALPDLWLPTIAVIAVRAGGLLLGSRIAGSLANAPAAVTRYAGFGLLPQAGLALALALLFKRTFPSFGEAAGALILSVVAVNELLAPICYRIAIERSGEAFRARAATPGSDTLMQQPLPE